MKCLLNILFILATAILQSIKADGGPSINMRVTTLPRQQRQSSHPGHSLETVRVCASSICRTVVASANKNKAASAMATIATIAVSFHRINSFHPNISPPPLPVKDDEPAEESFVETATETAEDAGIGVSYLDSWRQWWESTQEWWATSSASRRRLSASSVDSEDLTPLQLERLSTLREEIERADLSGEDLTARAEAVGFPLNDVALIRYFVTSHWQEAFPDGNSVLQSVKNTVKWREESGIWGLVTGVSARRQKLREGFKGGGIVWAVRSVCQEGGGGGSGMEGPEEAAEAAALKGRRKAATTSEGCPIVIVKPAAIAALDRSESTAKLIADLLLYTMERAEQVAVGAGFKGVGAVVVVDCRGCSLQHLKRFALAVSVNK